MAEEFRDKKYWAVILGGSGGLGLASAEKLARNGMNICIVHRNRQQQLTEIQKQFDEIRSSGIEFLSFNADALRAEKRTEIITELKIKTGTAGKIRALIHSIAKGNLKPMLSEEKPVLQNDDFHLTIEAMAVSLYDWVQELYKNNLFASDARVISFTSEGSSKAWKNYAAVSASKAVLESITRSIALEFASCGIRANCIRAGVTDTESFRMIPGSSELAEQMKTRNPFKRLTRPEDVADAVYLLCLDEAAWINGSVIPVNGGEHIS